MLDFRLRKKAALVTFAVLAEYLGRSVVTPQFAQQVHAILTSSIGAPNNLETRLSAVRLAYISVSKP